MANRAVENLSLSTRFSRLNLNYWMFRGTLFLSALSFYFVRIVQKVRTRVLGKGEGAGFEDLMDNQAKKAMEEFGIKIDDSVFEG